MRKPMYLCAYCGLFIPCYSSCAGIALQGIHTRNDFQSEEGSVIYDSILMRLQSIGENIKKIENLEPGFSKNKLGIEVDNIIRFRDLISHHYELMDTQIIYDIVQNHIPPLKQSVTTFIEQQHPLTFKRGI